jgi:probable phosphoglycerate mutase
MKRKLFYFVRHGESIMNAQGLRQGREGGLSEKGRNQAAVTGRRLTKYRFDIMLVSPYERTQETSEIINQQLPHPLPKETVELLSERRNPSEIIGKSVTDPEVMNIVDHMDKSYHNDDYRFSDEENFQDLKERARKLLDYLGTRREKTVLVVTHGIFLRMIAAYILYGDSLDSKTYNLISFLNAANNAAITVCEYKKGWFGPPPAKRWQLIAWDDYIKEVK